MAGLMRILTAACLVMLAATSSSHAYGLRWRSCYRGTAVVYSPVVVRPTLFVWDCTPSSLMATSSAPAKQAPSANPIPAPPSQPGQTKEPPTESRSLKGPTILESRSSSTSKSEAAAEKCKVGFWNQTGRDITVKIDGQPRVVQRDRAITVELGRSFVWQVDQSEPTSERVPAEESFHELIIRK